MSAAYTGLKRLIDIAGSLAGLLATAVLYVPIAIAIKHDSAGPVIFSQDRVGSEATIFEERLLCLVKSFVAYTRIQTPATPPDHAA